MFETLKSSLGNLEVYKLLNTSTGEYVAILSAAGAALNAFKVKSAGLLVDVVDGYEDESDFRVNHSRDFKGAKLFPFPNRVSQARYRFEGVDYELGINFHEEGHAIHGLLYGKPFRVLNQWATTAEAGLELTHHYSGEDRGYPFPFSINVRFIYRRDNSLSCRTVVKNTGARPMPLGDGWHPYFRTGSAVDTLELQLPVNRRLEVNDRKIPEGGWTEYSKFRGLARIGEERFDHCFELGRGGGGARSLLYDPGTQLGLILWQETGPGKYNYLQVYTPPGRRSIALEPMSCPPDGLNNGIDLIRLGADQEVSFSWAIEVVYPSTEGRLRARASRKGPLADNGEEL
ncbi:MAG: aldose 1-epimerase [Acidobacteriota bacterium]